MRIFHVALRSEWEAARSGRYYDRSTLGLSLAEVGFVHCSRADQWQRVRDLVHADVTEPLVLLTIDTDRLDAPLVEEPGEPGGTETFPHVYGAIPVAAVVDVTPVTAPAAERRAGVQGAGVQGAATQRSFSSLLMAEIGIRIALAVAVMLASAVAGTVVDAVVGQPAAFIATLVVLGLGTVAAIGVYRRWDRRTSV